MSERVYLRALCASLRQQHKEWASGADGVIGEGFVEIAAETVAGFKETDLPPGLEPLAASVAQFAEHWESFRGQLKDNDLTQPAPGLFAALDEIHQFEALASAGAPHVLESVAEFTRQKVGNAQIADNYGWVDRSGNFETWKVEEERQTPGKHVGPDFVSPLERKRRLALNADQLKLKELFQRSLDKIAGAVSTAPESLDELVAQKLSLNQIATMLCISPSDVMARCEERGLPMPPTDYDSPQTARAPQEPEMSDAAVRSFEAGQKTIGAASREGDEPTRPPASGDPEGSGMGDIDGLSGLTVEQKVLALSGRGLTNSDIAGWMTDHDDTITHQKVSGILRRARENPEIFA